MAGGKAFSVTLTGRLKNTILFDAAKSLGSQAALAKYLGVGQPEIGRWCNLQACPPREATRTWSKARIDGLEKKLYELTGKLLDDIFPPVLTDRDVMSAVNARIERTASVDLTSMAIGARERLTLPHPEEAAMRNETQAAIGAALKTLGSRERMVIEARFGIGDAEGPLTLQECGKRFGVSKERLRQIEGRALRKLATPGVSDILQRT